MLNKEVRRSAGHQVGVKGPAVPFFALKMMLANALDQALMLLLLSAFFVGTAHIIDMQAGPSRRKDSELRLWGAPL